jgi:hypothetical protein
MCLNIQSTWALFITFCLRVPQLFFWGFLLFCHNCEICRTWTIISNKEGESLSPLSSHLLIHLKIQVFKLHLWQQRLWNDVLTFKMPVFPLVALDISKCGCVWITVETLWLNKKSHHLHGSYRMTATIMAYEHGTVSTHLIYQNSRNIHIQRLQKCQSCHYMVKYKSNVYTDI